MYIFYFTQELHKLETDLGHFQQKWKTVWDKLELPTGQRETIHRNFSFNTQIVKSHGRSIHKRSTLEILVKGKMLGEAAKMFSQPHRFEKHTYTTPAYCDYCSQVLWGLLKTGKVKIYFLELWGSDKSLKLSQFMHVSCKSLKLYLVSCTLYLSSFFFFF